LQGETPFAPFFKAPNIFARLDSEAGIPEDRPPVLKSIDIQVGPEAYSEL